MAGSQQQPPIIDPVLSAGLDAIRFLGDRFDEPVTVIDRHFNVVYANRLALGEADGQTFSGSLPKCYAVFLNRADPCPSCPALEVFEPAGARLNSRARGERTVTCGLVRLFPLASTEGQPAYVLQILQWRAERAVPIRPSASLPAESNQSHLGDLIGRSEAMKDLFEMIRLVADSQATVLLQGESGTGKELVARTIHQLSYRREKPFVAVDCASLPETLLESELFGHVRGAFTGAHASKKGLFEEADGGTIFLDEIADTSAHFQAKLLRVLQEGEIKPVGSSRSIKVDARVISATNKNLLELIKARTFREDLYYRLAVLPLTLPPLRDRREDIPLLVGHFVKVSCKQHRRPPAGIAPDAMRALTQAPWPGNVRELQHTIERAVVTTPGPELTHQDIFGYAATAPAIDANLRSVSRTAAQAAERTRIQEALCQASGNKTRAARLLKVSRASLYNKLRQYQIA